MRLRPCLEAKRSRNFVFEREFGEFIRTKIQCPSDVTSLVGTGKRGMHIKLQGTHVNLVGEKGTRVPNFTVREITLEIECLLSVTLEFTETHGWRCPDGLKLEIIQLRKKAVGNSIPLPAGLVKVLLNLILPKARLSLRLNTDPHLCRL